MYPDAHSACVHPSIRTCPSQTHRPETGFVGPFSYMLNQQYDNVESAVAVRLSLLLC